MSTMLAPPRINLAALGAGVAAALAKAEQPPPPPPEPRRIVAPATLEWAIDQALAKAGVFPSDRAEKKRNAIAVAVAETVMALPICGVELVHGRAEIGEPIGLDNATVYTDGYGQAARITFDAAYPVWAEE